MKQYLCILTCSLSLCALTSHGQITLDSTVVSEEVIATNLDVPWEILWGPDDLIWFTERDDGRVGRVDPETGIRDTLLVISDVYHTSESGLLGMALHPDFTNPDSAFVYLVYTYYNGSSIRERLVRYRYQNNALINPAILIDNIPGNGNHNGSRLMFGPDGKLYMTTGDAQNTSNPQNQNTVAGKILRINTDGSIPSDNPDNGSYVWTFGHRNPQGLVWASNGILYSSEHGPNNDDEINIISVGENYGWPDVEGYCNSSPEITFCNNNNVVEPIRAWTPTIALAGLDYYDHEAIPEWQNSLLLVTLKSDDFRVFKLNAAGDTILSEVIHLNDDYGRLRDLCISPSGDIYISTSNRDGRANNGFPISADDRIIKLYNANYSPTGIPTGTHRASSYNLFPNPSTGRLNIRTNGATNREHTIEIMDSVGHVVKESSWTGQQGYMDVSTLPPGAYLYVITAEDGRRDAGRFVLVK
ncbi:MAG: PQQ-dependent sugar dehydrogenase [Flavobacteriales bacterium]|nr:PQQ-dependent sugar dehydrogenase [Flavobacteriales bacterium]